MSNLSFPEGASAPIESGYYSPYGLQVSLHDGYQVAPFTDMCDWRNVRQQIETVPGIAPDQNVFVGIFSSIMKPQGGGIDLTGPDLKALQSAAESPALMAYVPGEPDEQGNCRTICIWETLEDGMRVSGKQDHAEVAALANQAYSEYKLLYFWLKQGGELEQFKRPGKSYAAQLATSAAIAG